MTLMPVATSPGICLSASDYALGKDFAYVGAGNAFRQGSGRWTDGFNVEFVAGFPQSIAGWVQATPTVTTGIPREVCPWRDNSGNARTAIGTETHLYYLLGSTLTDITPLRTISTGTLSGPFTTTASSSTVAVADSSQTLQDGDWVFLSAASAVGGITINGYYPVSNRTGSGYDITVPVAAASSTTGGGTTSFGYPRITLTNPFTTTSGSPMVEVHQVNHGEVAGNYVVFSSASAVGGLTLAGEYIIASVVDSDHYMVMASSNANATTTGGGSVSVVYLVQVQQNTQATGIGWGQGAWGAGAWGVGLIANPVLTNGWTLAAYGNQLLAAPIGGTIYVYNPVFGGRAYPLLNAPQSMNAMFVTPERFVVALGINGNLLEMAWADQTDYTVWTTTPTNTANSGRSLVGGSYFVGGVGIRDGVSLIFTDRCVFTMTYTGSNEIYTTQQAGDNCGLVDPTAVCVEGGIAYWMSDYDFWSWNGSTVVLPSDDIRSFVFDGGLNRQYLSKCTASLNRAKRQVRFWYPSASSFENDVGMIYHYDQQCWSPLSYGRAASVDAELLSTPISADATGTIYYDETGSDANGNPLESQIELGLMDLSNGDRNVDVFGFVPDFQALSGSISFYALTKYYPDDPLSVDGPYTFTSSTNRQDLRLDGKMFAFRLISNAIGGNFRLGLPRLDVQPSGARR